MPSRLRQLPPSHQGGALLRNPAFLMLIASLLLLSILAVEEFAYRGARKSVDKSLAYQKESTKSQGLIQSLIQAEAHLKNHIATGEESSLGLYQGARQQATQLHSQLRQLLQSHESLSANSLANSPEFAQLEQEIVGKLQDLEHILALYRAGQTAEMEQAIAAYKSGTAISGAQSVDLWQLLMQNDQIQDAHDKTLFFLRFSQLGVAITGTLSLLVFFLYLRKVKEERAAQLQRQAALEEEQQRLEDLVQLRTKSLSALASHLQDVRDDERASLARELHDELGSLLAAAKMHMANLELQLAPESNTPPEQAQARLKQLHDLVKHMFGIKRRIIENLHPPSLAELGLTKSLEILAKQFAQSTGSNINVQLQASTDGIPEKGCLTLYRITQEALTNAAKYAEATTVHVRMYNPPSQDAVCLEVSDDGKGFDPESTRPTAYGLRSMQHRVESLGGKWRLHSAPGQGTTIKVTIPLGN